MNIKIINTSKHPLPKHETEHAAGADIAANLDAPVTLKSLERKLIPTGLFLEIPPGYEIQVRPRSGLAIKKGLSLLNTPGTIDADYRGELKIILINLSHDDVTIEDGERIAQIVATKHERIQWEEVETLSETKRGIGGFGSTSRK